MPKNVSLSILYHSVKKGIDLIQPFLLYSFPYCTFFHLATLRVEMDGSSKDKKS